MTELCHVCDLFRTALFGPTNSSEDHLDDGQGNDLPRPMADAPAMIGGRSRNRPSSMRNAKPERNPDAVAQPAGGNGATATPSVTSEAAAPTSAVLASAQATAPSGTAEAAAVPEAPAGKPAPRTKFSKRNSRGTKSPAYMSFDDVDIEEDDSDGELFVDDRRTSGSRSPGGFAAAYSVSKSNVPSVYREPDLSASGAKAPTAPLDAAPPAPAYNSEAVSSGRVGVEAGASMETFPTATGGDLALRLSGTGIGDGRVSINRDESAIESARPHGQSESFHGYKGYPGYEPDTPVAEPLSVGRSETGESLTINPGTEVADPRSKVKVVAAPTPSSSHNTHPEATVLEVGKHAGGPNEADYPDGEVHFHYQNPNANMSAAVDVGRSRGSHSDHVQVTSNRQQQHYQPPAQYQQQQQQHQTVNAGPGMSYSSHMSGGYRDRVSPAPSGAGSMAGSMTSSFRRDESSRNIPHMPSEDGMGSVLGTIAGTEDSQNEDLQWKRSALKKFHKVMVKGEGLRVVKHNRSGGSQIRIIRYDPEIKALVWNSKRYMKKAGSANVPIVGIKRVGREGNTVSVTAAGRGTIGFEPQRIRDAKILAEALRALVDKEERSAMWRG